jgi:3-deoxy-7-phosphoheptulonate synthase
MSPRPWLPESWREFPARQQPPYPDPDALGRDLEKVRSYPPIVGPGEIEGLKQRLGEAARGRAFILQGGNCAERFLDCNADSIANQLKILLQMSVILTYGARRPVIRVGRLAGQYAKPRSRELEEIDGVALPTYRGDAVNSIEPDLRSRTPDPSRLLSCYFHSVATLNHIRALIESGFADLRRPYSWNLQSMPRGRNWEEYRGVVDRILDAIHFMESFGGARTEALGKADFFTSHEGLLLGYEEALTRYDPVANRWYNTGAHLLWIGVRTRQLDGAHVEYFRGIGNPIAIKIDAQATPAELLGLLRALNPADEEGKITFITRMGAHRVEEALTPLVRAVVESGHPVAWSCDPMHGNTVTLASGRKTRDFSVILDELTRTFRICREQGSRLCGVHFELTPDDVTECVGGSTVVTNEDLERRYETYCDPRLNDSQSLEMAFLIARLMQGEANGQEQDLPQKCRSSSNTSSVNPRDR